MRGGPELGGRAWRAGAALVLVLACGRSEPPPAAQSAEPAPAPAVAPAPAAAVRPGSLAPGDAVPSSPERAGSGLPPTAKPSMLDEIRADLAASRSASDGGGRAWIERGSDHAVAGQASRFPIVYEAGPLGISVGGSILVERRYYWYWSTPQISDPAAPGFVTARCDAPGVELALHEVPRSGVAIGLGGVAIEVRGRPLRAGERVHIVFGAGPAGAVADAFAEHGEHLWLRVDGDGDGVAGLVVDSPALDVAAGPPEKLELILPTTAHAGDGARLVVSWLDAVGNLAGSARGDVELEATQGLELPPRIAFSAADGGHKEVSIRVLAPGIHTVRARGASGDVESNPLVALPRTPRVLWADLHGHSNLSDGTGTPDDYFRYARDVAALDVSALTDHDHVGARFLDENPEMWEEIRRNVKAFHEPGRFVTLLGFEWTNWIYGHRHVLYFGDEGEVLSSVDPRYDTPAKLWEALRGRAALTVAHHPGGGPVGTDWRIAPDAELEPDTEIASVHGSSESLDTPFLIHEPVRGNFVRDALGRGYRLGFLGSGDSHDGHPGLVQRFRGESGGIAAILSEDLTREGVLEALRARRVYATNGPRIYLSVALDGMPVGSVLSHAKWQVGEPPKLAVLAVGVANLDHIDLVRSGRVEPIAPGEGRRRIGLSVPLRDLAPGEYVYVRAVQTDGGAAWSSPFFIE